MTNPYAPPDPAQQPEQARPEQARPDQDRPEQDRPEQDRPQQAENRPEAQTPGPERADRRSQRPEPEKPTPEQMAPISRAVLRFGLLMLAAVLTAQLNLPWQLLAPLLTVAAIVVGVRTLVQVIRQRLGATIVVLLSGGLALSGMLLLTTLGGLMMWNAQMERQQCLSSALTVSVEDQCERAYEEAVNERFGEVGEGG